MSKNWLEIKIRNKQGYLLIEDNKYIIVPENGDIVEFSIEDNLVPNRDVATAMLLTAALTRAPLVKKLPADYPCADCGKPSVSSVWNNARGRAEFFCSEEHRKSRLITIANDYLLQKDSTCQYCGLTISKQNGRINFAKRIFCNLACKEAWQLKNYNWHEEDHIAEDCLYSCNKHNGRNVEKEAIELEGV